MSQSLAELAPEVLAAITAFLPYGTVFDLAILCGDIALRRKLGPCGGVQEVVATEPTSSRRVFFSLSSLALFAGLTRVVIYSENYEMGPSLDQQWILKLPPTLSELDVTTHLGLFEWTRPVDGDLDGEFGKYCDSRDGRIPITVRTAFPNLRVLHAASPLPCRFTQPMIVYFVRHLPRSLTSLSMEIHGTHECVPFSALEDLPELKTVMLKSNYFAPLASVLDIGPSPTSLRPETQFIVSNLSTIVLDGPSSNASAMKDFPPLSAFVSLETLILKASVYYPIILPNVSPLFPRSLTRLELETSDLNPKQLISALDQLPRLSHLSISAKHPVTAISPISWFPPTLTSLEFSMAWVNNIIVAAWPPALTHLVMNVQSVLWHASMPLSELTQLASFETSSWQCGSNPSPLLPPSLTSLMVKGEIWESDLFSLPSNLRRVHVNINLEARHARMFDNHWDGNTTFTADTVSAFLKRYLMPQLSPDNIVLHLYVGSGFWHKIKLLRPSRNLLQLATLDTMELLVPSLNFVLRSFTPSLTSLKSRLTEKIPGRKVATSNLIELSLPDGLLVPPAFGPFFLPTSLRHLELKCFDNSDPVQPSDPSKRLPEWIRLGSFLQTLRLHRFASEDHYDLSELPTSLTDLSISSLWTSHYKGFDNLTDKWLPNLRNLELTHAAFFPLRIVLGRLPSFKSFNCPLLAIHSDILPLEYLHKDESNSKQTINSIVITSDADAIVNTHKLSTLCLMKLIPARFRHRQMRFDVQWDQNAIRRLPSTLRSLTLANEQSFFSSYWSKQVTSESVPQYSLQYLPQALTDLDLSSWFAPIDCPLPGTLLSLRIVAHLAPPDAVSSTMSRSDKAEPHAPSALTHSSLRHMLDHFVPTTIQTLDLRILDALDPTLAQEAFASLPRHLTNLTLSSRSRDSTGALLPLALSTLTALPPALLYFDLRIPVEPALDLSYISTICKSLVSLHQLLDVYGAR